MYRFPHARQQLRAISTLLYPQQTHKCHLQTLHDGLHITVYLQSVALELCASRSKGIRSNIKIFLELHSYLNGLRYGNVTAVCTLPVAFVCIRRKWIYVGICQLCMSEGVSKLYDTKSRHQAHVQAKKGC